MTTPTSIRTILVPLDGSETGERALPWVKAVANDQTNIVLMEVAPVASSVRSIGGQVIGSAETIQEGYRQIAEEQLADAKGRWFGDDDRISTVIAVGDPGDQILATAAEQQADLIVMSSHGRGAIGRFVSGSVADRVVRTAPLPVMIVGHHGDIPGDAAISRIIAPVEDSDLSMAALPVAAALSNNTGAPVTVLNAIVPVAEVSTLYPATIGTIPPSAYDDSQETLTIQAKAVVDKAVDALAKDGVDATSEVFVGNAAESVLADLEPGDVVVLSSHARAGLSRWVIGSTTMKLVQHAPNPIVVVTRESIEQRESAG